MSDVNARALPNALVRRFIFCRSSLGARPQAHSGCMWFFQLPREWLAVSSARSGLRVCAQIGSQPSRWVRFHSCTVCVVLLNPSCGESWPPKVRPMARQGVHRRHIALLTSNLSHHELFGFPVRLCGQVGFKFMCAGRRKKASQTKHVFDNLGTAAEIPEQGKFGTLIGSYPNKCWLRTASG